MVRWAEGLNRESVVLVEGIVQKPQDGQEEVHSTRVHNHEVKIEKVSDIVPPLMMQFSILMRPRA